MNKNNLDITEKEEGVVKLIPLDLYMEDNPDGAFALRTESFASLILHYCDSEEVDALLKKCVAKARADNKLFTVNGVLVHEPYPSYNKNINKEHCEKDTHQI